MADLVDVLNIDVSRDSVDVFSQALCKQAKCSLLFLLQGVKGEPGMDKNSNGGVKVSVSFMTFFLCKKEHFNNLDQFSNMDFPSIKYLFFFFCQLIFSVQNKNEGTCFIQTQRHTPFIQFSCPSRF